MNTLLLLVGTKKGLFLLTSRDRNRWELGGPFHTGREINHAIYDPRSGSIFAAVNDAWFGSEVARSTDLGKSWHSSEKNPAFAADSDQKIERIWHIEPGGQNEPDLLFAGVAPAALFATQDRGQTWTEVSSLTSHPSRSQWEPGAGGLCLHSIVVDSSKPHRMFVGISAVGVFRSDDAGQTWQTANKGTRAGFLPDPYPEFGQCVHKLLPGRNRSLLFQQNHCGVYRSNNAGESWVEITAGCPRISASLWRSIRTSLRRSTSYRSRARNSAVRPRESCVSFEARMGVSPGKRFRKACHKETPLWEFTGKEWRPTRWTRPEFTLGRTRESCLPPKMMATPGPQSPTIYRRSTPFQRLSFEKTDRGLAPS